ncbi:rho GTPase-activating protein 30 [Chanos chanos]|uniref:Rho GTPase-activating protein 30 n=1 Tax=Chanos chanos TaxID=29144 RepID=A0A6J2V930_CHACN|nr:rho GTPase-activating protein 30 [Chanos chanos]
MRRGRRKGGNKDKVFGCDLLEHLNATGQDIPQVLRSCSEFIEEHGIVDGIYRLSGVSSNTQKLRSEFDNEGTPELYRDVYLQDIHCVSSLCKAYFRELPNPLLTYQLYDRFAEAVAVQLEDERLVKIKEVLRDLPPPHYRTLEYLMRHLVWMGKHASETNMHARNLAIVWAPNLLRSKDIEASGFNGTAAFMEVRVQSIVVEFILTHVDQLFPEPESGGRRKSLPSPSPQSSQEEPFFRAMPFQLPRNVSPGDAPLPMRSYHDIIDDTEKRKGSLKGRKWKSIFNLGARLHDPRKKNKASNKEKEKTSLRPAKSMDSLSAAPYSQEGQRQRTPANQFSPLSGSSASPTGSTETGLSGPGSGSSSYAVTFRRTGGASVSVVSGGSGTQGTYNRLDSGNAAGGANGSQNVSRSPALQSRAERRAGIHISGPFSVTVPLHITSGLAFGVLQGGRGEEEQVPQESGDADREQKVEEKAETEKEEQESIGKEHNGEAPATEDKNTGSEGREETLQEEEKMMARPPQDSDVSNVPVAPNSQDKCDVQLSVEEESPDQDLPLDFQDTFGFLDSMESSTSYQNNEFSVEPPCYEDEEEEEGKSHSLPYKSCPFLPATGSSSDEEYDDDDDDEEEDDSDKGDYEDMFFCSLPSAKQFHGLRWSCPQPASMPYTNSGTEMHPKDQSDCSDQEHTTVSPIRVTEGSVQTEAANSTTDAHAIDESHDPRSENGDFDSPVHTEEWGEEMKTDEERNEEKGQEKDGCEEREEEGVVRREMSGTWNETTNTDKGSTDPVLSADTRTLSSKTEGQSVKTEDKEADGSLEGVHSPSSSGTPPTETPPTTIHSPVTGKMPGLEGDQPVLVVTAPEPTLLAEQCEAMINELLEDLSVISCSSLEAQSEVNEEVESQRRTGELEAERIEEKHEIIFGGEKDTENMVGGEKEGERDFEEETETDGGIGPKEEHQSAREDLKEVPVSEDNTPRDAEEREKEERDSLGDDPAGASDSDSQPEDRVTEHRDEREDGVNEESKVKLSVVQGQEPPQTAPVAEEEEEPKEGKNGRDESHNAEIGKTDRGVGLGPGLGRTLVVSKQPPARVFQAKAVPVVPPKPQHSKLAAFNLKQQFQLRETESTHREGQHADSDRTEQQICAQQKHSDAENSDTEKPQRDVSHEAVHQDHRGTSQTLPNNGRCKDQTRGDKETEGEGKRERSGTWDAMREIRPDGLREGDRETKRNSGISICFDEAVARATGKRGRESEREREKGIDAQWERGGRKEGLGQKAKETD